jgi:phage/plasmid primase-like uncharacterized protein
MMASHQAHDLTEQFRRFIIGICDTDPGIIVADGRWHRFRISDTRHKSSKPGRYLMHADGKANGIFMDWRDGKRHKWFAGGGGESIDRAEIERRRAARKTDQMRAYQIAAEEAVEFWRACSPLSDGLHPYLARKGVMAHGTRQGSGKRFGLGDEPCVIVPLSDGEGNPLTLQAIREDGERRFWPGSTHEGAHFLLGKDDGTSPILFCEGYSTAATLHEATGHPVVMCVNSGNMATVARWAGHRWAGRTMVVAGDDDWHLIDHPKVKRNVGREAAHAMAKALGGVAVMPDMAGLVTNGGDDFNDMAREYGLAEVKAAFVAPATPKKLVNASPFVWRPVAQIPKRQWLYGKHLLRKFVSVDVAAGGVGKSSLKIGEALSLASGNDFYGKGLPEGAVNVWLWNLEDPLEELERRIHATAIKFNLSPADMEGRLFIDSGRENPLVIATEGPDGCVIARPVVDALIAEMIERKIDVLTVDPFISSHAVSENDNNAIDVVAREWNVIAERTGAAINLVHHVRKQNGAEATADSARGASALIGKARSVIVYNRMTKDEAQKLGVPEDETRFYFRIDNDKANLAPPDASEWYRMNNVDLENGDSVGVACSWSPPSAFEGVTARHLYQIQKGISEGEWRFDPQTKDAWVGHVVASVLDLDLDEKHERKKAQTLLATWIREGALRVVENEDRSRRVRKFVTVGVWVSL